MSLFKPKNKIVRANVSKITKEQIDAFRKESSSIDPKSNNVSDCSTDELIEIGVKEMKKCAFTFSDESIKNL